MSKVIVVYSKENCSQCKMLENILNQRGVPFDSKKMDVDYTLDELMEGFDQLEKPRPKQFPIVFVDNEYIGSLQEAKKMMMQGKIT